MQVPVGKGVKTYKLGEHSAAEVVEEAALGKLTGYLRITTGEDKLLDYYIFLKQGTLAGAAADIGGGELYGQEALNRALEVSSGIASVFSYSENQLLSLFKTYPAIEGKLEFTYVAPRQKQEAKKEEPKKFFRLAGIKVPYREIREVSKNTAGINLRMLIEKIAATGYTCGVRTTAEAQNGIEEGLIIIEKGMVELVLLDMGKTFQKGEANLPRIEAMLMRKGLMNIYTMSSEDVADVLVQFGEAPAQAPAQESEKIAPAPKETANGERENLLRKYRIKDPDEETLDNIINSILGGE